MKQRLLQELSQDTYVMLKPSAVHGIGVFAIRDIPKGCKNIFSPETGDWIKLTIGDVEQLPEHSRQLVETYCLYDNDHYFVPGHGFKVMDLVSYLNHSPAPNIRSLNQGEFFETLTEIPAGTELLVNYDDIVEVEGYE